MIIIFLPSAWQYLKDDQDHHDTDNVVGDGITDDDDDSDHNDNDSNMFAVCEM